MIEKIDSSWKPFVKLSAVDFRMFDDDKSVTDIGYVYLYANEKPSFIRYDNENITEIRMSNGCICVRETPEEIVAALSEMADDARKKEAEEQERYLAERVKQMEALKAGE